MIFKYVAALSCCLLLTACRLGFGDGVEDVPGESVQTISVAGGQMMSEDQRLTLTFPSGALATATEITIKQLAEAEIDALFPILDDVDFVYELGPDGYTFLEPITVSYLLPAGADIDAPRAMVSVSNGVAATLENVTYDINTGRVTGTLSHFSEVVGLPLGIEIIQAVPTVEHFVGEPSKTILVTARASYAILDTDPVPAGVFSRSSVKIDSLTGSAGFQPVTASGSDRYLSITNFSVAGGSINFDQEEFGDGSVTFAITCNEQGVDTVRYRFNWADGYDLTPLEAVVSGSFDLETEVTCIEPNTPDVPDIPPDLVPTLSVIVAGQAPEAVKKAGSPPYADQPESTAQRFITSGLTAVTIFDALGETIQSIQRFAGSFGALYLQHSTAGDFYLAYGANGRELCALPDGFCQIDSLAVSDPNTTSVEYGVDANGNQVFNQAYRVRGGSLRHTVEDGAGWLETEVFDGSFGQMPNTNAVLFAYEPLTPFVGIGITADGHGYFIDLVGDTATEFSDTLGAGLRDIECDQFSAGNYGCAIQSYTDSTITPCGGTSAADFSCGAAVNAGDGVSLGVAVNDAGNLAVVGADYTDSSIHAMAWGPTLAPVSQIELPESDWGSLGELSVTFSFVAHVELDAENDSIILTGNGSDNAIIIPIDDLGQIDIAGAEDLADWFE